VFDQTAQSPCILKWALLPQHAQKGDREGFCALVDEMGPAISNFLRQGIADAHELEDVCQ
jgi:DNA-directed RNA polymerase specialized sigma24 family protein